MKIRLSPASKPNSVHQRGTEAHENYKYGSADVYIYKEGNF